MKYALRCFVALLLAACIGCAVNRNETDKATEPQPSVQEIPSTVEPQTDSSFAQTNPIVYQAIQDLKASWTKLDNLEKSGIDIGSAKQDVQQLAGFVRETGNRITVTEITVPGETLNATETVVYNADLDKGEQLTLAAGFASFKNWASNKKPLDGTIENAKKHVKWSAVAVAFSEDAAYTKYFTDAHEYGHPANFDRAENFADTDMDLKNNAIGREIGLQLMEGGKMHVVKNLDEQIAECEKNGKLVVIK